MTKKASTRTRKTKRPVVESLEPRILYSADFAPGVLDAQAPLDAAEQRSLDAGGEFLSDCTSNAQVRRLEIVFVDAGAPDVDRILADLRAQSSADRDLEIVTLDATRDGIGQISAALAGRQDVSAVHILSHGSDGAVDLGDGRLDFDALLQNAAKVKAWGSALSADADLLIYGCNVAQSDAGRSLVDALARLTGADVAGSDDLTGHAELGGDWELEYRVGSIEADAPISLSAMLDWRATLEGAPVGGETLVNTTTGGAQTLAGAPSRAIAMNAGGAYVVVWTGPDAAGTGVFAQRYDVNGVAQGTEMAINTTTLNAQSSPAVAIDGYGNFVVAWNSNLQDGSGQGVYARRFNADGTAASGEFLVNTTVSGNQSAPVIAMNAAGTFVIAWEDAALDGDGSGVYAQRYNAAGATQGGQFRVNTTTLGDQFIDSAAMDAAGNFVITFASSDTSSNGVYFQRYNASGGTVGGETQVNTTILNDQSWSSVAMDPNGNFVVVWRSDGQDGSSGGIYARRYNSTGTAQGGEFRVNTTTAGDQANPSVAMDANGNFVVAWASYNQDGPVNTWGIYKQEYNANGTAAGGEVRVNTTVSGNQINPWVGMNATRDFVIAWSGEGAGDATGVFAQRYWSADPTATLVYGESAGTNPTARSYSDSTGTWSGESTTTTANPSIRWTVAEKDPYSSEQIVGVLSDDGSAELDILRWTGTAWTRDWTVSGLSTANSDKRSFDVAYEQSSGDAMVVYANGTNLSYRTWNGSSWSAAANVFATPPTTGTVLWAELASRPGSNEIALVYSDSNNDLGAVIWNGTSWQEVTTERLLETDLALTDSASAGQYRTFDAAYEASGQLLVAWGRSTNVGYATYMTGTGWSGTTTMNLLAPSTGNVTFVDLAAEAGSDRIALLGIDENSGTSRLGLATWTGSAWANVAERDSGFNHLFAGGNADSGYFWGGVSWVGSSGKAVAMYSDADTGRINYATWTAAGGWAVQADVVVAGMGAATMRSVQLEAIPGQDKLLAVYSDSNSDLWAATYDGTSWTVGNAGVALEASLSTNGIVPFDFSVAATGSAPSLAGVYQQSAAANNLVVIEAENHDATLAQGGESWSFATSTSGYSGKGYVVGGPDGSPMVSEANATTSARLDFQVNFTTTGTHYLWIRGYSATSLGDSDSVFVGLDGTYTASAIVNNLGEGPWIWKQAKQGPNNGDAALAMNVTSTGVHTLNLWVREDGVMLDKILLTTNAGYTPTGAEAESTRGAIESAALAYSTGQAATAITSLITARDADDATITGATVQITGNYRNGQDVLGFSNVGSVVGTWNATTGTVTFTGTDTLANYQAALRSITYQNTSATPEMLTRTVSFAISDSDGASNTLTRQIELSHPTLTVDRGIVSVDGAGGEASWAAATTNTISTPVQGTGGSGAADLSGTWKATWDSNYLYFLVNVSDNQRSSDSAWFYDDDGVEIFVDAFNDGKSSGSYDSDDGQFYFNVDGTFGVGTATTLGTTGINRAVVDNGSGYTVEVAIPWTTIGYASAPSAGQLVGVDVHINDDDGGGGRDDKLSWESPNDLSWTNPSLFGTMVLTASNAAPVAVNDSYSVNEDGTLTVPAASDWWNTSWTQRRQLTFDNTAATQNLADFPVLVKLDSSRINYAMTQNGGQDLRFVDGNGTVLAHEIESWNESGTSYVWVRVPQVDAGSNSDYIWMYYGNAAAADGQSAEGVWDAAFDGVWHFNGNVLDAAGTNEGTNFGSTGTTGAIGGGRSFDGNDYVATSTLYNNPQEYTIEAWFRTTSASGDKILGFESSQTGTGSLSWDRMLYVGTDGRVYFGSYHQPTDSEDVANSAATYTDGNWHYAVGVRNDSSNTLSLYVDGVLVDSSANLSSENYSGYWRMGGYKTSLWPNGTDGYFNGGVDEARVSSQMRSADWIRAQYLSGTDAFVSFGSAQGIGVLSNDSDGNGDALTAVLNSTTSNGTLVLNANGSFTYTPNANFNGTDTFTYYTNDGSVNSNLATVTITVASVNDAPTLALPGGALAYLEDQSAQQLDTTATVADVEDNWNGGTLSVNISAGAQTSDRLSVMSIGGVTLSGLNVQVGGITVGTANAATVSDTSTLTITFNATATDADVQAVARAIGFHNTNTVNPPNAGRTVTFMLTDAGGGSSGATKGVTVTRVNDAPTLTATAANPTYTEGGAAATLFSAAAAGTVEGAQTIDRLVLTVSNLADGALERLRIDGTFVALTDLNTGTTLAGYGVSVSVTGSTATVTIDTGAASTTAINTLVNGLAFENTSENPSGTRTVTLTSIRDSGGTVNGGVDTTTLAIASTVTLVNVNDAPTGSDDGYSVNEDASLNVAAAGVLANDTDADGDPLTAVLIAGPTNAASFTLNADGSFTYAPSANFSGSDTFTYRASDGSLESADITVTITVNALNDAPVITSNGGAATASISIAENTTAVTTVTATDADAGATLTYSIVGGADQALFGINPTTGALSFAAGRNYEAPADAGSDNVYDVTVQVSDGTATDTQAIAVTITDADEFDVGAITDTDAAANAVAENAAVGTAVGITASASDADGTTNAITYSLDVSAGGRFAIDSGSGVVTVAGALDREAAASYDITVRASSADGSFSTQVFTINLADVDEFDVTGIADADAVANSVAENTAVGAVVGLTASASDADATNSAITYSLDDDAGGRFAINGTTGVVTVATALDAETAMSHGITVRATSADGSTSTQAFTINVSDVDEFDVGAVTDANAAANSVAENAANGTAVGITALASDADATSNGIAYSLDDSAGGRFTIDSGTGVVSVANGLALDREMAASHTITVRASSADGSVSTQSFTVIITDVDEADVGPVSDADATADAVAENAGNGTLVGITASASDADATTNAITYALDDSAGGRFAINATTGVVSVADGSLLDREAAASHTITVRATSADGSASTANFTISLGDVDEFDVGPVTDANAGADAVAENAANGTVVAITGLASDADATNNGIAYSLDDDAGGRFAIDGTTGVVTVANGSLLDREAAASHDIVVRATSTDGSTAALTFTIAVVDADEFNVTVPVDANGAADTVAENVAVGTAVGITAQASDADATTNAVTFSLDDSAGGRFSIEAGTGVVRVAGAIDREAAASYDITVRATSADGSTASQVFTILVADADEFDVGAVGDADGTPDAVVENAAIGTAVGITATAADADATTNTVTYSLDDSAGGRFAIDAVSGVVTVANGTLLDREAAASHDITVRATSLDGSSSTQVFTIALVDANESPVGAVSDTNGAANSVAENAVNGTAVGITALAADPDATTNAITYSLDDDAGGRFAIDGLTGVVTVANGSLLDRETAASHDIVVRATSVDSSFSTLTLSIVVSDVNEVPVGAVSDTDGSANAAAEDAAIGTTVGITAFAADADATTNAVTYTLDDDAGGAFAIDPTTGVVTVAAALDAEAGNTQSIVVRATSADGSWSTQGFTIAIGDVNEAPIGPLADSDGGANSVSENALVGTAVGVTALATDPDATASVSYTLDDDAGGRFAIDGTTGVVTVAGALDRESAASHTITARATSTDGSSSTQSFVIAVTDADEFDVSAVSDVNPVANSVSESAAIGAQVGLTAFAADADATNNAVSYSLDDDAGGRFAIDATTGIVTVAGALDAEAMASHDITVRATSLDGSSTQQTFTIAVTDVDEFDVGAVSDADAAANTVLENAANGAAVGITAFAQDADATGNAISYSLDDSAGGRFAVDPVSGLVTVANGSLLDREAAASHDITVRATSADGSSMTQTFTIALGDADEFDVGGVSDTDAAVNSVAENAAVGTAVGVTAFASDPDATTNTVTYSLVDNAGGRFSIEAATGIVRVAGAIDREAAASHDIVVRATSADGSSSTATFTVAVTDVNESPVGAVSDVDGAIDSVAENAANGTVVGVTTFASDPDATTNTVTYSLDDDAGGRFLIDGTTGVVTVADGSLLDREAAASHDIVVRATSVDGSSSTATFTIAVTDVNEAPVGAVADTDAALDSVAENAAVGTLVGVTAFASDPDATTNTVTYSLDDNAGGRFSIEAATGIVRVAGAIDREAAASHDIVVRATSADGSFSIATFTIAVTDVNESPVGAVSDTDGAPDSVVENAVNGTVVGVTAFAADPDATTNTVTYSLDDDAGGRFLINGTTGVVTVADGGLLDREAAASHDIVVRATSADGSSSTATFTIAVTDVNESPVGGVGDADGALDSVAENAAIGTVVGVTAFASDPDATTNTVTYSLDDNAGGRFSIEAATGIVRVAGGIDREAAASHDIVVRATSADGSSSTATFTIAVTDVNEAPVGAVSDTDGALDSVAENAAIGTVVGVTAFASDPDATTNTVTYSLDDSAGGRFSIEAATGIVRVAGAIDREAAASHDIVVRATSADGSFSTATFTIAVTDVNEAPVGAVSDTDATLDSVAENAANGTVVGVTAFASDPDATTNTVTYSLDDDAGGRFLIDGTTGVVTVADGSLLDREAAASHDVVVRATSVDGSSSTATFTIAVTDVNEAPVGAISDTDGALDSVAENAAVGTAVGVTAFATDPDATNNTVTYSLDDDAGGRFSIEAATGIVRVAGAIDREAAASHDIVVRATSADGSSSTATFAIAVTDVNESPVGAVADTDAALDSVAENAAVGTVVGVTAFASDPDATTNAVTYSLDDDAGGRFSIEAATGIARVAGAIDREAAASHDIIVRATSADGSFSTATFTIAVTDVNESPVSAVSDTDGTLDSVAENAAIGTAVGVTAFASDADATTNTVTYALDDDAGGRFSIEAATGIVRVAGAIDREAAASHDIIVRATSADGSFSIATFTIAVTDVNEAPVSAVSDTDATLNSVAENAANATVVGVTAFASDPDATTNTVTYSLDDDAGGRFLIDGTTGVVTVADGSLLDREAAASHDIVVRAASADGSFSTQTFTIAVTDVNESPVGAVSDVNGAPDSVAENAAIGTVVGVTASASDPDATNNTVTYSLDDDAGGRFSIEAATGIVRVAGAIDREAAASHDIVVRATSADSSSSTQTFTIAVTDVNEAPVGAVSDTNGALDSVAENAAIGTAVGVTAFASDPDATTNTVTYTLDDDAGGRFSIDAATGIVRVAGAIDREAAASHDIVVRATSADGSSSTATFTIAVTDVNESPVGGVADTDATLDSVAENAAVGTLVGVTAFASDPDATTNTVTYSLDDDAGGRFSIEAATGIVRVAGAIDREAAASHDIVVRASSADGSTSSQTFTVAVTDVNEAPVGAVSDADGAADNVAENAANGTMVGVTAFASDPDATTNTVTYSLDDDAGGRFLIDGTTGVVTVADGSLLDREAAASHDVVVRATSADGSFSTQTFTIALADVNEYNVGAVSDWDAGADTVPENSAAGTVVGVAAGAVDLDATNSSVTFTLDDSAGGRFAIDSLTGVMTVAGVLDAESAASHAVIVRATSADGSFSTQTFTIAVSNVDEAPSLMRNTLTVTQGTSVVLSGGDIAAVDPDTAPAGLVYSVSNLQGGQFELAGAPGAAVLSFTQAQINAGQVVFVHGGAAQAPAYDLGLTDGTSSIGPFSGSVSFSLAPVVVPPPAPGTQDQDAPGAELPPPLEIVAAPLKAEPVAAAPELEPFASWEFSPGRPDASFNDILAQNVELMSAQKRPLPKLVQPVLSLNEYDPEPPVDLVMQLLNIAPTQLEYRTSTPVDWEAAPAFEEGFQDEAQEQLQLLLDSVRFGGMALSVGVVWWASRISAMLGSLLASTPAWRHIDPLPVVSDGDDEKEKEKWLEPDARDVHADELAVSLVLEGGSSGGRGAAEDS